MQLWMSKWVSESLSVLSDSLQPHGLQTPWNSPGQNTGVGSLSLLQGIFSTQGSNPSLLHWRWILYPWTEEPGGLQSMVSQRVGQDWTTKHNNNRALTGRAGVPGTPSHPPFPHWTCSLPTRKEFQLLLQEYWGLYDIKIVFCWTRTIQNLH